MKKVVIDTNVLVSSVLSGDGNPSKVMNLVSKKKVKLFYSKEIISEYKRVLEYEKLNITPYLREEVIKKVVDLGTQVDPIVSSVPLTDEDDRTFYDTAKENDAILVTGNVRHYPDDSTIMTPSAFLDKFK